MPAVPGIELDAGWCHPDDRTTEFAKLLAGVEHRVRNFLMEGTRLRRTEPIPKTSLPYIALAALPGCMPGGAAKLEDPCLPPTAVITVAGERK